MKLFVLKIITLMSILMFSGCSLALESGDITSKLDDLLLFGNAGGESFSAPEVEYFVPFMDARNIPLNAELNLVFNKSMDATETENGLAISSNGGLADPQLTWISDRALNVKFRTGLSPGKRYEVRLNSNAARDTDGNYLNKNYISYFYTVGSGGVPAVASSDPAASDTIVQGWPVSKNISVTFSEPMDEVVTADAVTVSGGPAVFAKTWNSDSTVLTLDLLADLEPSITYTLKVSTVATAQTGLAMNQDYSVLFHTGNDAVRPGVAITATLPSTPWPGALEASPNVNAVSGVSKNSTIQFTFTESMDRQNTINAISFLPVVAGKFNWLTDSRLEFTPDAALTQNSVYTLSVADTARDSSGLFLDSSYLIDFTVDYVGDSTSITFQEIAGLTPPASPGLDTPDISLTSIPDPLVEQLIAARLGYAGGYEYRFDLKFNTAGAASLKVLGDGNIFDTISIQYISGGPDTATPTIISMDYVPSGNPQIVTVKINDLSANVRYRLNLSGGVGGLRDTNENYLAEDDIRLLFYDAP